MIVGFFCNLILFVAVVTLLIGVAMFPICMLLVGYHLHQTGSSHAALLVFGISVCCFVFANGVVIQVTKAIHKHRRDDTEKRSMDA